MPDLAFPRLEYVVLDGHEIGVEYDILEADMGDGYAESALVGSPHGLLSVSLTYNHLARSPHRPRGRFSREAVADYLWEFFCARMREGNAPFIVRFMRDRKDYLFRFREKKLGYREAFNQRFYTTGIELIQARARGVNTLEDGSLGESVNPDVI
jgi:hypothetical protein